MLVKIAIVHMMFWLIGLIAPYQTGVATYTLAVITPLLWLWFLVTDESWIIHMIVNSNIGKVMTMKNILSLNKSIDELIRKKFTIC